AFLAPSAPPATQALHPLIWLARRWTSSMVCEGTPALRVALIRVWMATAVAGRALMFADPSRLHPFPDPQRWEQVDDPAARLRRALGELYAYWGSVEAMFTTLLRDQEIDPERTRAAPLIAYMAAARDVLAAGWGVRRRRRSRLRG